MRQVYTFLIIYIVIVAGFISVPRCYVMQPDCPKKGTQGCPLESYASGNIETNCNKPCYLADSTQQLPCQQKPSPNKKLSRFKIDQYRNIVAFDIEPPSASLLQYTTQRHSPESQVPAPISTLWMEQFDPPPFPIILQKQSFLI